jgi:hypothetical protein
MKMNNLFLTLTIIVSLTVLGSTSCSKHESGGATIDTGKVQSVFAAASAADKEEVDTAIAAIKAGDYVSAVTSLKQAAASVNLTPEQKQAIQDVLAQVEAKISGPASETAAKVKTAGGDAAKQAGELHKAVGK